MCFIAAGERKSIVSVQWPQDEPLKKSTFTVHTVYKEETGHGDPGGGVGQRRLCELVLEMCVFFFRFPGSVNRSE